MRSPVVLSIHNTPAVIGADGGPVAPKLIGPATSGFTTASVLQSGISTGASYLVKKSTGKSISEHAIGAISQGVLQQTYIPSNKNEITLTVAP